MNADAADERRYTLINSVSYAIIGAAQRVSNALGVGFLEKVYENALAWELRILAAHAWNFPGSS